MLKSANNNNHIDPDFEVCQPRYNGETEAAMKETRSIMNGSIPVKKYSSVDDMFDDALAEDKVNAPGKK